MNDNVEQIDVFSIDHETLDSFVGALMFVLRIPEGKHLAFIIGGQLSDSNRKILYRWVMERLWMVSGNEPVDWLSILGRELEGAIARREVSL